MDAGGEWHYWYEHNNNTRNILYQEPGKIIKYTSRDTISCCLSRFSKLTDKILKCPKHGHRITVYFHTDHNKQQIETLQS